MGNDKKTMRFPLCLSVAVVFAGLVLGLLPASPAAAGPCATGSGSFSEDRRDMSGTAPCTLSGYARKASTLTLTVPVDRGGGTVRMICDGGPSYVATGGWAQDTASAGECVYKVCYETGPARPPVTVCDNVHSGSISVSSTPVELCPSGASETNTRKNICVFDTASSPEITGTTGDDMIRVKGGARAYLEGMNLPPAERLRWVQWISADTSKDLMMPSGPPPATPGDPNAYKDLRDFLNTPPPGVVQVEPACYAVTFDACTTPPPPPPVAGLCGPAMGQYYRTAPTGTDALCYIGSPTAVADTGTGWRWTCSGERGGPSSEACNAYKPIDGQCGPANGHQYYGTSDLIAAGLCAKGAASPTPSGSGPWSWSCVGTGTGAVTASCSATVRPPDPVPGQCGVANGGSYATSPPAGSLCAVGAASPVTGTATGWQWSCAGQYGGPNASCSAAKPTNGVCGPANGRQFGSASEVVSAGLCGSGTASPTPSGAGPWSWTCSAGGGGTPANCSAQAETCEMYFNSMVLVQDLSGSFGNDLGNLYTQMQALVDDPDFQTRKLGLARLVDIPHGSSAGSSDYDYQKDLNLTEIGANKTLLTNRISGWATGYGGDGPESQLIAIKKALTDFSPQSTTPLTIILSTDAVAWEGAQSWGTYPTLSEVANLLKAKDARLIALVNNDGNEAGYPNTDTYYRTLLTTYGVKGAIVPITGTSSNFLTALKAGMTEICTH